MFKKVLVPNRGEVALRIIQACRELGISTVVAHSRADAGGLPVQLADEAVCVGPARSRDSYLNVAAIVTAARFTGADAVHPGYGFLSENVGLAEACQAGCLSFIGPPADVLRLVGDKTRAKQALRDAGLSVLTGSESVPDLQAARRVIERLGYPAILKATAGGGGRGMRVVRGESELVEGLAMAAQEAEAAFGDPRVYLETYLDEPRHVEFQVLADAFGGVVHLGERECSLQRRHQKVVEESPSPTLSADTREKMGESVNRAAHAIGYVGVGTFEFLVDAQHRFHFLEVNARLQVEHAVTEMVTGVDIVKTQIGLAAGERLSLQQADVSLSGHALECRINAEHPETFASSPGAIRALTLPGGPGIRVDTAARVNEMVSPFYDSLLAKVIAQGRDRAEAISRMRRALDMTIIEGVETTLGLHRRLLRDAEFLEGRATTATVDRLVSGGAL